MKGKIVQISANKYGVYMLTSQGQVWYQSFTESNKPILISNGD